ncbi:MAG: photosystem II protein, Psb35-related [Waterburya sp.]
MTTLLIAVLIIGWIAAAVIGTQAYFLGEQTKPIHERNLKSESFEQLAKSVTGRETNYSERIPAFALDTYTSNNLPQS